MLFRPLVTVFALFVGPALCAAEPVDPSLKSVMTVSSKIYDRIQVHKLANGMRVYLAPVPESATVSVMTAYKVGSADEELSQTGLSHYLEHLMFKGTDKMVPGDVDRITQRNGGRNNAYTTEDMTVYHFDFAADRWTTALDIEADRMRNLKIDEKHEFQQEKGAVISELAGNEDNPWDLESKMILPLLFGEKNPYGHSIIGATNHVKDAKAEIIKRYYDTWYHPNNCAMVVVGGFDPAVALETIKNLFGKIPSADLPKRKASGTPPVRKETVVRDFASKFETPRLLMGYNTVAYDHPDSIALDILQSVLTKGKMSRLHKRLVTKDELASTVEGAHQSGRLPGWFNLQLESMSREDLKKCQEQIGAEFEDIARNGVTPAELARVRRNILAEDLFQHESVHDLADMLARVAMLDDLDYLKGWQQSIVAVTSDDLKRVAKKYFVDARGVVIHSLPALEADKDKANAKDERLRRSLDPTRAKPGMRSMRDKEQPKEMSGSDVSLSKAKTIVLPNSLKIILLENPRLPIAYAKAEVRNVRMYENAKQSGIAELLGDTISEGTRTRTAEQISEAIESTGGSMALNSDGGALKVLAPDLEAGLDLLLDSLIHPDFPEKELETKRELLLSAIDEQDSNPRAKALQTFKTLVYGKHPFGRSRLGEPEIVEKITRAELRAFHRRVFVPNNTVIAIVGDFNSAKVEKAILAKTADWKSGALPKLPTAEVALPAKLTEKIISDPNAAQLHVYAGHVGIRRENPDYHRLMVMDYILGTGTGFTDRLSSTLRDRQGLAYTVTAAITNDAGTEPGTFSAYIGTFPDKYRDVRDGFLGQVNRLRDEAPTKEEVESVQRYLTGSYAFKYGTGTTIAAELLELDQFGLEADYGDTYRKAIAAVTPAEVQQAAKKYLRPDRMVIVVVGPVDETGKALEK